MNTDTDTGVKAEVLQMSDAQIQIRARWFFWGRLVDAGKKHNFGGAPVDENERAAWDGRLAKRRAKNRVAKQSRKVNR